MRLISKRNISCVLMCSAGDVHNRDCKHGQGLISSAPTSLFRSKRFCFVGKRVGERIGGWRITGKMGTSKSVSVCVFRPAIDRSSVLAINGRGFRNDNELKKRTFMFASHDCLICLLREIHIITF